MANFDAAKAMFTQIDTNRDGRYESKKNLIKS
jgi:hypothetical protein